MKQGRTLAEVMQQVEKEAKAKRDLIVPAQSIFMGDEADWIGILKYLIEGGDLSKYGLSNAITRASQDIESYDRATVLEEVGWQVATMEPKQWKILNQ